MMAFRTLRSKCALLATVCVLTVAAAEQAAADTITLQWDPSSSTVGYRVHVGTASGAYSQHFDAGSSTLFAFNTAVAGQRYCFAVSAYLLSSQLEGPNSVEVCGYSNAAPTLQNPGTVSSTVGQPTSLQLVGSDPQSQPLTYSATGLPPGLSVQASTGYISGTGTTSGTYSVTARASDGVLNSSQVFTWIMNATTSGGSTSTPTPPPPTGGSTGGSTGPDSTRPTIAITGPTSGDSFATSLASITVSGIASDNVGVARVMFSNDQTGVLGQASGTTNWSTSIALAAGTNYITVRSYDAAGNQSAGDFLTVVRSATTTTPPPTEPTPTSPPPPPTGGSTGPDSTRPTVAIAAPTSGDSFTTSLAAITVAGFATDNVGVTRVMYSNDQTGTLGQASGTTNWSASIALAAGTNYITVRSYDAAGNQSAADYLTITRSATTTTPSPTQPTPTQSGPTPNSSTVRLGTSIEGITAYLEWTGASWPTVDVYRNGVFIQTTANDGYWAQYLDSYGRFEYTLCAPGSLTVCSNTSTVTR